jgi:DNA-binding NtrC family response regulator
MYQQEIRLVVLDMMSTSINGYEVYENLKRIDPKFKMLIITGYSDSDLLRMVFREEAVGFIQKPITPSALLKKINILLEDKAGHRIDQKRSSYWIPTKTPSIGHPLIAL